MAPFNLENNIREKLENRELIPSPDAWKKLESQLPKMQPKRKSVGWYYLAASVVAILIVSSIFLNRNNAGFENKVVKENVEHRDAIQMETEIVSEQFNSSGNSNLSEETKNIEEPKRTKNELKPSPPKRESAVDKKIKRAEALADVSTEENTVDKEKFPENDILEQNKVFNDKVDEVVASVKSLQETNKEVTAEEVEALLNNARRDIQTQMILSDSKVDATALLQEVEWELEKSFRDKVFDALGEGFKKIRTAVLERND